MQTNVFRTFLDLSVRYLQKCSENAFTFPEHRICQILIFFLDAFFFFADIIDRLFQTLDLDMMLLGIIP